MKVLDRTFSIGAMLLVIGVVWAFTMDGIGTKEWILLLLVTVLGIVAGVVQGRLLFLNKRGQIGSGKMSIVFVIGGLLLGRSFYFRLRWMERKVLVKGAWIIGSLIFSS